MKRRANFVAIEKYSGPCEIRSVDSDFPVTTFKFNNKNQKIYMFSRAGGCAANRMYGSYYFYDSRGNMVREEVGQDPVQRTTFYEYDELNNLVLVKEQSLDGTTDRMMEFRYEFNDDKTIRVKHTVRYSRYKQEMAKSYQGRERNTYDSDGNLILVEYLGEGRTVPIVIEEYKYDKNNQVVQKDSKSNFTDNEYNDDGTIFKTKEELNGLFPDVTTYYEYDKYGNILFEEKHDNKEDTLHRYRYWYECWEDKS